MVTEDYLNPPDIDYSQGDMTPEELEDIRIARIEAKYNDYKE